ncbi:MAG TPA: cation:proton antiporter [Rhodocyclaceae bacterium]|nr:cation:proton antiporter [Rhodocyclaceae bacterium]HMV53305.1 cation:proton antiporter [Rhodocyclaceae bacterium]HMZ83499.1 cation:proton antiporter [Rhodocyclaceae bacterium]HNA03321.1 cation:proton antiporter [Rhodocyclaceae bacterium]HNB77032.1 cation:proton antiporter [Rhodocyclaceae bacterium]
MVESLIWPAWPLQGNELMRLAFALLLAAVCGEGVARLAGLPRVTGYSLAGLLMGPALLGWFGPADLDNVRIAIDLALALLLFELGVRLDVRWFRANPWVLVSSLAEATLAFVLSFAVMRALGHPNGLAATVAAIAVGTSPSVVMRVAAESRAEGQVTQRLFVLCALNVAYSIVLSKLIVGGMHGVFRGDWLSAVLHPVYLLAGSLLVGAVLALAFRLLRRAFDLTDEQGVVVLFGLLLLTLSLLSMLKLPSMLAPLIAGAIIKYGDPRPHLWPRHFGTAGGVLVIALFMLTGMTLTPASVAAGGVAAVALLAARLVGKLGGVMLIGAPSGLSVRQSTALGMALLPMSGVAFLLTEDIRAIYPFFGSQLAPIVLSMVAILELFGPIAVQWALRKTGEARTGG